MDFAGSFKIPEVEMSQMHPVDQSSTDPSLVVNITDAVFERNKVKFTVYTKTTLPDFKESEFNVLRGHDEFVWLYDRLVETEELSHMIIPPSPTKPDFDFKTKLQKFAKMEHSMPKEESQKAKKELQAEILAAFKKTVAVHQEYLTAVASHPSLRKDMNFKMFLECKEEIPVKANTCTCG
jgi:sorting nexin-5/6/32